MIDLFHRWANTPFEYGVSDCCQFVGACLERKFGWNPAREFLYMGEDQANDMVETFGGIDCLLTDLFGESHSDGKDGDIALIDDQQIVGYVHGHRIVARAKGSGLNDLPLSRATRFWNV